MTEEALAFLSVCGQLDDKPTPKVIEGKVWTKAVSSLWKYAMNV
jgi:hypothetical protein